MSNQLLTGIGCLLLLLFSAVASMAIDAEAWASVKAAQAYRANGEAVQPAADGTLLCEAEEFRVQKPGWTAQPWGENYYAATFANCFLSRKAFLGAPEQGAKETVATINLDVKTPGKYLVLARYEAAYRFETQFRIVVEQKGKKVFDQVYGARENLKIWAFRSKLKTEVAWGWGAVENVVWEGYLGEGKNRYAELQAGPARVSLIAGKQPEPAAKRNVDLIMLTQDEAQVKDRIDKENYLPLDGWLTQAGDVYVRVTNPGAAKVKVTMSGFGEHSPYWVHMRNWKPAVIETEPGATSDWVEVGSAMDALNDGQWGLTASGACKIEFGARKANGVIEKIKEYPNVTGTLALIGYADIRYSRLVRTRQEGIADLIGYLKAIPMQGKTPTQTLVIAGSGIMGDLKDIYGLNGHYLNGPKGYIDLRGQTAAQLEDKCRKMSEAERANMAVVSLGDEIGLPAPNGAAATEGFITYLKAQGVTPGQVDPAAGDDWTKIAFNPNADKAAKPGLFYWSMRYHHHYGLQAMKELTTVLRKYLPNAGIGANYSPHGGPMHAYLGDINQWVNVFREDAMTMPWGEDYIWQLPVGSPQMNSINIDMFRAGIRGKADGKILYYVMPHMPGNTPAMWRRLFYSAMGHGTKIFNLFEFDPVWAAYTENHVTGKEMYGMVLKTFREYGLYEDIVQAGQKRPAQVGLWFSDTADIWHDYANSGGAAKRALYITLLSQQLPLDFVVEQDALDGVINQYKVIYLTDQHVSQAASKAIAAWVRNGGRLFATAGAGMLDEYNRPNTALREVLGVEMTAMKAPENARIDFVKQDLPFAVPADTVTLRQALWGNAQFPVFGAVSLVKAAAGAEVLGAFADGSPAVIGHKAGQGETLYCAFMPGLSYFKPAIPKKPLDRGNREDAMAHFLPVDFDKRVGGLVGNFASAPELRPVLTSSPQVEATILESKAGTAITLTNWTTTPVKGLKVTAGIPLPGKSVTLSTGKPVKVERVDGKTVFTFDLEVADTIILR